MTEPRPPSWLMVAGVVVVTGLVAALAVAWLLEARAGQPHLTSTAALAASPSQDPPPEPAADRAQATACAQLGAGALTMAGEVDSAFERHAHAHHLYQQKKIEFGDPKNPKPGTVLWIWRATLAEREAYSPGFRRMAAAFAKECR